MSLQPMSEPASTPSPALTPGRFTPYLLDPHVELALANLSGLGKKSVARLHERGILDQLDLIMLMPRKYQRIWHFPSAQTMRQRRPTHVELTARIHSVRKPQPNTRQPFRVTLMHEDMPLELLWFGLTRHSFMESFEVGRWIYVRGDVAQDRGVPSMLHPDFTLLNTPPPSTMPPERSSIRPIYPSFEGVADKLLREAQRQALIRLLPELGDVVPLELLRRHDLPGVGQALRVLHVLDPVEDPDAFVVQMKQARARLVYEEFFTLQLSLALEYAQARQRAQAPACVKRELGRAVVAGLPFGLTGDQRAALATLAHELSQPVPMRRLLQGDVGSGKTIVALVASAIAADNGYQSAIMAPTDILARQHLRRAQQFFTGSPLRMAYLGGSLGAAARRQVLGQLERGELDVIFGTHALFQEDVRFRQLGLVVIDEHHKFGVEQRELLLSKGQDPHLLAMTATPIPRSLAHAAYGDLDLTVIRQKPPGRQPVKTVLRNRAVAPQVYAYVRERVEQHGEQVYFVYPMVEASQAVPGRENVMDAAQALAQGPLSGLSIGVLHGRMSSEEKDQVMSRFAAHELQVLCATTVIEVGVDVSNATIMVIESPEVFGLSQLHQLRGRVGRGDKRSLCVLLAGFDLTSEAQLRLEAFAQTEDGFKLAQADLEQRGPGQFLGVRQAGVAEFRFGDLARDAALLQLARQDARERVLGPQAPVEAFEEPEAS